jgi:hypothetical protein
MKRILILIGFALLLPAFPAGANDLFTYDEAGLEASMSELNTLENYLLEHEGATLQDIALEGSIMLTNISAAPAGNQFFSEGPLGIPGFFWGFCFNLPGLIIVHLVVDDELERKNALIGCLVSSLLYGGGAWWRYF